ncbi:MAG TPA: amidohydrolase, partial [Acidimicrobiia bacterium]|nr:amidohydrolase [Acidimicrobiia bacterium]
MTACISADSHVTEPPGTYVDRIDARFKDRAPRMHFDETLGDVMLIDNGATLVPFWLVAAAGRPTEEVRLDTGKRFDELHRGGWDPHARLVDQDTDGVQAEVIYPSVGMIL